MDYRDRLPSREEEIESIQRYMGFYHANESEVMILPFSKVKSSKCTTSWEEYKYYDVYDKT